jgi:S1-C subfamily serine protease
LLASPIERAFKKRFDLAGLPVGEVHRDGPADRAGIEGATEDRFGRIRLADVIVAVDGEPIEDRNDILDLFEEREVGDRVRLTLERDGERRDVQVKLVRLN